MFEKMCMPGHREHVKHPMCGSNDCCLLQGPFNNNNDRLTAFDPGQPG